MTGNAPTRLAQLRAASLAILDGLPPAALRRQSHPELSPLLWHVGHVFFVETYWLAERVFEDTTVTDAWRHLYFPEDCPKDARSAQLPDAQALRAWTSQVSAHNDDYWRAAANVAHPLLEDGYLAAFLRQHYAQHLETMRLAAAQLRLADNPPTRPSDVTPRPPHRDTRRVVAHRATIGTPTVEAYDNETPCFTVDVATFEIARRPVTNAEWLGFMAAGGYDDPRFWDDAGWTWRSADAVRHPQHWRPLDGGWHIPADSPDDIADQPVHGIGWYEARAFARYADARLPGEIEWEAARRAHILEGYHRVWEWCDNSFAPYPGFSAFPYDGYSRPWFDGAHAVARGASVLTEPEIRRPGFRNFYPLAHRHIYAGLRLAW